MTWRELHAWSLREVCEALDALTAHAQIRQAMAEEARQEAAKATKR